MKKLNLKKDRGIALIISLFFLVLLFAIGTALLFRSGLSKKTSKALSNNDFNNITAEGIINTVASNISSLNYDQTNNILGTSLSFEGKLQKFELSDQAEPAYIIASNSSTTSNNSSANVNNSTTKTLFEFTYNGIGINKNSHILDPNDELEIAWNVVGPNGDASELEEGDNAYRYAFLIIDQTGKIDPNYSVSSETTLGDGRQMSFNTINYGIDWDILNDITSTNTDARYDLINMFPEKPQDRSKFYNGNVFTSVEQMYEQNEEVLDKPWDNNDERSTFFRKADNSENLKYRNSYVMNNFLYPYSDSVIYKEKSVFNLKSIEDGSLFTGLTTSNDKVGAVIKNIPYLQNFPSKEYVDPKTSTEYVPTAQREQIAASLIDYIDDDIKATHNYTNMNWSIEDWRNNAKAIGSDGKVKGNTKGRPYCGFEGFFIESICFFIRNPTTYRVAQDLEYPNSNDPSQYVFKGYSSAITHWTRGWEMGRIQFDVYPRVHCTYDLNGKSLKEIIKEKTGKDSELMLYYEMEVTSKVTMQKAVYDSTLNKWVNQPASKDPSIPNSFDPETEFTFKQEVVLQFPEINKKGSTVTPLNANEHGMKAGFNRKWMHRLNNNEHGWLYDRGIGDFIFSPYKRDGGPGLSPGYQYTVRDVRVKFTKPLILFIDDDPWQLRDDEKSGEVNFGKETFIDMDSDSDGKPEHAYPEPDEIVQVFELPAPNDLGFSVDVDPNEGNGLLHYANVVDPRLSHLASSYRALEDKNFGGTGWRSWRNGWWMYRAHTGAMPIWAIWKHQAGVPKPSEYEHAYQVHKITGHPSEEDLKLSYPRYDAELVPGATVAQDENSATDHDIVLDPSKYEGISDPKTFSSLDMPVKLNSSGQVIGFGGINNIAEIGKLSRGEPWRSLNISQLNMKLYQERLKGSSNLEDLYAYATNYDDPVDSSKVFPFNLQDPGSAFDDDFQNNLTLDEYDGGDAEILEQIGVGDINPASPAELTIEEKTVRGTFNPNTTLTFALKSLLSPIKTPRKGTETKRYIPEMEGNEALPPWKLNSIVSSFNKDIQDLLADKNNDGFADKKLSPFSRKYSFSTTEHDPGDSSYQENFNLEFDSSLNDFKITDIRTGSIRFANIFAKRNLPFLTDIEREFLYTNSREFISTRYNYFSAIILVEPLKIVPDSAKGSNIRQVTNNKKAQVNSHYKIRAELSHDILTNNVTVLDYEILN